MSGAANELYRRLRELWREDFEALLRRIAPELLSGSIPPGALPPGTVINRGSYSPATRYRTGDLVIDGNSAYVALRGHTGVSTSNTTYWQKIAGPNGDWSIVTDEEGNIVYDEDGEVVTGR
jgi:hypothetical protein